MPANYFDERIARSYRARWPELFDPAVVDPAVRFLAEQVACFANVAAQLEPGGSFVVGNYIPQLQRLHRARPSTRSR